VGVRQSSEVRTAFVWQLRDWISARTLFGGRPWTERLRLANGTNFALLFGSAFDVAPRCRHAAERARRPNRGATL